MTPSDKAALTATAGKRVNVGGRDLVLAWPTPADLFVIDEKMAEMAGQWCQNPLAYVHSIPAKLLSGDDRLNALALAIEKGAGGGVMPSPAVLVRAYNSPDGLRYRLWRLTRKTHPELTDQDIAALVTDENRPDVIDLLDGLLRKLDPKATAPPGAV